MIAPGTDDSGAVRLADRVLEALATDPGDLGDLLDQIRAGFYATQSDSQALPEDLLLKATSALQQAQSDDGSFRVRGYDA